MKYLLIGLILSFNVYAQEAKEANKLAGVEAPKVSLEAYNKCMDDVVAFRNKVNKNYKVYIDRYDIIDRNPGAPIAKLFDEKKKSEICLNHEFQQNYKSYFSCTLNIGKRYITDAPVSDKGYQTFHQTFNINGMKIYKLCQDIHKSSQKQESIKQCLISTIERTGFEKREGGARQSMTKKEGLALIIC